MIYDPAKALKDSWRYTEGIREVGFAYSPDRDIEGKPAAPAAEVKARPGNPTQNQIAVAAATFGYRTTDQVFTIWANTLREFPRNPSSPAIIPVEQDRIIYKGVTWIIMSCKTTQYETQFLCYCQKSQATPS